MSGDEHKARSVFEFPYFEQNLDDDYTWLVGLSDVVNGRRVFEEQGSTWYDLEDVTQSPIDNPM